MAVADDDIRQLIGRSCLYLDREDFASFLRLCGPDFTYEIRVYSAEIRKDMVWMHHDRATLETLMKVLPEHLRLLGTLMRHASVYLVERNGRRASVTSSLIVMHTDADGQSRLFAGGHYYDEIALDGDDLLLLSRTVRLETRDIGIGWQAPI